MSRVLVTGASGQLGAFVVARLATEHRVSTLDVAPSRTPQHPHFDSSILDPAGLAAAAAGMDSIVHLAALDSAVDAQERAYIEANVLGTWQVLEAAEAAKVRRVILCSSVAAVGLGPGMPADYLPVDEAHPCRPRHAYGLSKQLIESVGACFARRGTIEVICLRPAFVIFPGIALRVARALADADGAQWPASLPANLPPPTEALTPTRAYVAAEDAAECFAAAVNEARGRRFRCYFVAARDSMPAAADGIGTIARAAAFGSPAPDVRNASRYGAEPRASMFSSDRARAELGWEATRRVEDVVLDAIKTEAD